MESSWRFPFFSLTEHQSCWQEWYSEEERLLKNALSSTERISHIGSTAVSSIWAKPIIDILVEVPKESNLLDYKALIANNGYICMSQSEDRISFNKGYTENGFSEKVFHLHLRYAGDNDELYFRDYLMQFPEVASEYEKLKLSLWKQYEFDRDGYTNAKGEFVRKHTQKAKELYGNKY